MWLLLHSEPAELLRKIAPPSATAPTGSPASSTLPTVGELDAILRTGRVWFWVVLTLLTLHLIPAWFFYENVVPTGRRWKKINALRNPGSDFDALLDVLSGKTPRASLAERVDLVDPRSGHLVATLAGQDFYRLLKLPGARITPKNGIVVTRQTFASLADNDPLSDFSGGLIPLDM
jgi:hypothetical protein